MASIFEPMECLEPVRHVQSSGLRAFNGFYIWKKNEPLPALPNHLFEEYSLGFKISLPILDTFRDPAFLANWIISMIYHDRSQLINVPICSYQVSSTSTLFMVGSTRRYTPHGALALAAEVGDGILGPGTRRLGLK